MESSSQKPNLEDLQTDVVRLLGLVSELMHRASTVFISNSAGEKYHKFHQEVTNAARNVEDFELRMAIVAPMKAGKSTIVNAIVGQELLPSRNAAMTTIPTEIIFDDELTEPILSLSPESRQVFTEAFFALQHQLHELGIEGFREKLGQYPHLATLAEQIAATTVGVIYEEILGRQPIASNLASLNDIIRLCSIIAPLADPLSAIEDIPRIYTPFWRSQTGAESNLLGKLAIVDTPGPNEAGENLRLANVVSQQLEKCSLVLIVLDFTQLKTQAAEKVKQHVQKAIDLLGKENLYVLINKVDQRREGDLTPEQVRQFVAAELGIGGVTGKNQVFEISARQAFCAANFMQELEQHQDDSIVSSPTARLLAQEVFGIDWEEELLEATRENLLQKAKRLWKKSGFAPFLENAVQALMAEAAPRCLTSALNTARSRIIELQEDVQLRTHALYESEEKLQLEISALSVDLESLELCRDRLHSVEQIKTQLYQRLDNILEDFKKVAKATQSTYFITDSESLISDADFTKNKFVNWITQKFTSPLEMNSQGIIEFKTLIEAENFADIAISYPQNRANILLGNIRDNIQHEIEEAQLKLTALLERETASIVERARDRLKQSLNVDLSLPTPKLSSPEIDFTKPRVKRHVRTNGEEYQEKVVTTRKWWYWLGIVTKPETIKVKAPERREAYYTVSLEEIVNEVNQLILGSIKDINLGLTQYLEEDFQQRVDSFFNDLDRYFSNYSDSLQQAQADQKLSLQQQANLVQELNTLLPEAIAQLEKVDTYLEATARLKEN